MFLCETAIDFFTRNACLTWCFWTIYRYVMSLTEIINLEQRAYSRLNSRPVIWKLFVSLSWKLYRISWYHFWWSRPPRTSNELTYLTNAAGIIANNLVLNVIKQVEMLSEIMHTYVGCIIKHQPNSHFFRAKWFLYYDKNVTNGTAGFLVFFCPHFRWESLLFSPQGRRVEQGLIP